MSKKIRVVENQTLAQIAKQEGFTVKTLMKANPTFFEDPRVKIIESNFSPGDAQLLKSMINQPLMNPNVLATSMEITIPDKKKKKIEQQSGTSATYTVEKLQKEFLSFTFDDENNEIQEVQLTINGKSIEIAEVQNYSPTKVYRTKEPLPDDLPTDNENRDNNYLTLKIQSALTGEKSEEQILVNIGGVDPILDPTGNFPKETDHIVPKKAVQKLLRNLGYYDDNIDGDLEKHESFSAIASFQTEYMNMSADDEEYGLPNLATCVKLVNMQGTEMSATQPLKIKKHAPMHQIS